MLHGLLAHALAEALLSAPGMLGSLDLLFNPTGLLQSLSQAWGDLLLGPLAAIEARSPSQVLAATVCCCFQTMAVMLCLLSTSSAACGWIVPIKLYSCPFFYHLYTGFVVDSLMSPVLLLSQNEVVCTGRCRCLLCCMLTVTDCTPMLM